MEMHKVSGGLEGEASSAAVSVIHGAPFGGLIQLTEDSFFQVLLAAIVLRLGKAAGVSS